MSEARPQPESANDLIARLEAVVGPKGLLLEAEAMAPHLHDRRERYRAHARAVVKPAGTEEVAEVVRICAAARVPMVPQGGNTGLVGGGIPNEDGRAVVLSLARMNRIRELDPVNDTMTVEAGCILQNLQAAAAEADRLFPLSLGAEGSCMIGGNLSTNAGGIQVLRYGNARELTLGLEVVLPDGRVWDGLRALRKDNTGYDLKQLFIGAEGTLGVITAAVLRLYPRPRASATAFIAVPEVAAAVALLGALRAGCGEAVTSFELIPRLGLDFALRHVPGITDPLAARHDWYVLAELWASAENARLGETLEAVLAEALEAGLVVDAALATSEAQAQAFWRIREGLVEAQKFEGGSIKHDIAVPISGIAEFVDRASEAAEALVPGIRPLVFGHIGDGNIHLNLTQPEGADTEDFLARWDQLRRAVYDVVVDLNGSISAEHGIGRLNLAANLRTKSEVEIDLMRKLKRALDPAGVMNPGRVVPE
jgi:FAD/FMN-containing dehydrogenase